MLHNNATVVQLSFVRSSNSLGVLLWQDHKLSLGFLISDLIQIGDNAMPLNSKVGMGTEPEQKEMVNVFLPSLIQAWLMLKDSG